MKAKPIWLNLLVVAVLLSTSLFAVLAAPTVAQESESALLAALITERLADWTPVIAADALYENLTDGDDSNDPLIISVRSPEDYAKGHIPGAYNIPWKTIADDANLAKLPTDKPIVTYCYTGHTGQVAATILRVLGYDATNLKYGMMGWTDDAEVLAQPAFAGPAGYPVQTEPNELTATYDPPVLETGMADAVEIAKASAQAMLPDWTPVIAADALYENLTDGDDSNDPFILSVRSPEDYAKGHVPGAYNVPWKNVAGDLTKYPTDKPIVTYCYTGHTGQVGAVSLALLGYDVTNLKYGMMGWTDDAEVLAQPAFTGPAGYPVQTEANELPGGVAAPATATDEKAAEPAAPAAVEEKATEPAAAAADESAMLAALITERFADWTPTIAADALYENLTDGDDSNDPLIVSVRSPEDYAKGHIPGAYNIPWKTIADDANLAKLPADKQIVVYCYTGHTGQVATTILRILGYDATNLKYGMMGWTDDMDVLATKPFEGPAGYPVQTEPNELTETYTPPMLDTGMTDAVAIAKARAQAMLPDWTPTIAADALYENLTDGDDSNDPFILSVRSPEDYAKGHIPGAHNIPWKNVAADLTKLPSDLPIVAYCYTGHTGQAATTALALLGYNVTNLKYGMMGWTDDMDVLATKPFEGPAGYPVQTEANAM